MVNFSSFSLSYLANRYHRYWTNNTFHISGLVNSMFLPNDNKACYYYNTACMLMELLIFRVSLVIIINDY